MKKLIAVFLMICLISGYITILPAASAEAVEPNAAELLYALGCVSEEAKGILLKNDVITRGEFAEILSQVALLESQKEVAFEDVNPGHIYSKAISAVYQYNIMLGDGNGKFNPDKNVTELDAAISILRLLGYEDYAYYNGGYPSGYYNALRNTGLTKDTAGITTDNITGSKLSILLKNMLNERFYEITGVIDGNVRKTLSEKSFLSVYYQIEKISGVVTANSKSMLNKAQETGGIIINDKYLVVKDSSFDEYLGFDCDAYFRILDNSLVYMEATDKNDVFVVEAEQIVSLSGKILTYEINKTTPKNITIPADAYIIYNGRAPEFYNDSFFDIKTGEIKFIDNDSDGKAEVVSILSYETFVVESVNPEEEIITLKYNEGILTKEMLKDVEIFDKKGKTNITWLNEWTVLDILKDEKGKLVKIYAAGKTETKLPSEICISGSDSYVVFSDGEYAPVHKKAIARLTGIKNNVSAIFAFDMFGNIIGYVEDELSKIAALAAVGETGSFEPDLVIKYYTETSELLTKSVKGRIKFNKEHRNLENAEDRAFVKNALQSAKGHLIEVDTDVYGNIVSINIMEVVYDSMGASVYVYLNNYANAITPDGDPNQYFVKKSANAFYVPNNLSNATIDDFAIRKSTAVGSKTISIVAYKRLGSEDQEADAVRLIKYASSVDAMGAYDHPMLISGKTEYYDSDEGKTYTRLKYWHSGSEKTSIVEDKTIIADLAPGDVAWLDVDGDEIMGVLKYYDYSDKAFTSNRATPARIRSTRRMQFGKVYEAFDNFYRLQVTTVTTDATTGEILSSVDSLEGHRYPMYGYVFDDSKTTNKVRKATVSDFIGYTTDPQNYSNAFVHSSYTTDYMAVIYK